MMKTLIPRNLTYNKFMNKSEISLHNIYNQYLLQKNNKFND